MPGWGIVVPITTNLSIKGISADVYDENSKWIPLVYSNQSSVCGQAYAIFKLESSEGSIQNGQAYLVRLTCTVE